MSAPAKSNGILMVNRSGRNQLFDALRGAVVGRLTGFECENVALSLPQDDGAFRAFCRTLREMVDENDSSMRPVFAKATGMRKRLARALLFLKTDLEYQWPDENLPPGILDFYRPTLLDRLIRTKAKHQRRIARFMEAGDYPFWPFISERDFNEARLGGVARKGLRLLPNQ